MTPAGAGDPVLGRLLDLVAELRRRGVPVSTTELLDACRALRHLDLLDRRTVEAGLQATLVKDPIGAAAFPRAFALVWDRPPTAPRAGARMGDPPSASTTPGTEGTTPAALSQAVLGALEAGDEESLDFLAARAVDLYGGDGEHDGSSRYMLHRVLRALDLSRMLSAAMGRLRQGEGRTMTELELVLRRQELARLLEHFRRQLAAEIADRGFAAHDESSRPPGERDLLALSAADVAELRRTVAPLARQLAARIGRRRRLRSTGRLDPRTTVRRSLQSGGVPLEPAWRRRRPHRPQVVLLCDVSGSVAEFAQFTFTLVHALHAELSGVRSFAFVDGVAEVTDVFEQATHHVMVGRLLERQGLLPGDGHSDYGQAFERFCRRYLDEVVSPRATLVVTGDARTNYRSLGLEAFRQLAGRARAVYWLNPEPQAEWGSEDSAMAEYRSLCTNVFEVRTLSQLTNAVATIV